MDIIYFLQILYTSLLINLSIEWSNVVGAKKISTDCSCGLANDFGPRIVGGTTMNPHKYPWMAIVLHKNFYHCGGSVINNYYILSAAHCVFKRKGSKMEPIKAKDFAVIVGAYDRERFDEESRQYLKITSVTYPRRIHDCKLHDVHDISLLRTQEEIVFSWAVSPVCLPQPSLFHYYDVNMTISGWGLKAADGPLSRYPLEVIETVLPDSECLSAVDVGYHFAENPNAMFCAYKKNSDACKGDSGGPVVTAEEERVIQIGIVSWGIDCAKPGYPGVFTKLPHYVSWIFRNTEDATYCGV